jgi:hypothetical protein
VRAWTFARGERWCTTLDVVQKVPAYLETDDPYR